VTVAWADLTILESLEGVVVGVPIAENYGQTATVTATNPESCPDYGHPWMPSLPWQS